MNTLSKKMLVTSALPYANGHLHLGHLLEHIQTDVWVRAQKMQGHECISVCADDAHGTPIMLKSEQLGITPEELTRAMQDSHEHDFHAFSINYDCYHTTHSAENKELAELIYYRLVANNNIVKQTVRQAYDPVKNMFLPDRYVKGSCPCCKTTDQYGDNCEACGSTYSPMDLIDPISVVSGIAPIEKDSEHYFLDLNQHRDALYAWVHGGHLQTEVVNKLDEWFKAGLKMWDISRDAPYFGFMIPGTTDKYFYVWLDAPIGYMASFKRYCDSMGIEFDEFWNLQSEAEVYHFVGKDVVYFHALFWPALLMGSAHRLPTAVFTHGFLTVNGHKMSKSRGTFIEARTYLQYLNPNYLRYYLAAKMNGTIEDIDLNFDDFINKVNAELIGKLINIASRCAGFINKTFNNQLADKLHDPALYAAILHLKMEIIHAYNARDYASVVRKVMDAANQVNQYIDQHKPWIMAKEVTNHMEVHLICTMGINLFRLLITYLKPILPQIASNAENFLNAKTIYWDDLDKPILHSTINLFIPLMLRVERTEVDAMLAASTS